MAAGTGPWPRPALDGVWSWLLMFFHRNPAGLAAAVLTVMHGYRWGQVFWLAGLPGQRGWPGMCARVGSAGRGVLVFELGILGPVRAVRDGRELGLGGPKQRAVLALLLVRAGQVLPAEYLVEALWRGRPPPGAAGTLRSYVSRLRSLLGPEAAVVAHGGGYAITVQPGWVDASRFERLVEAGRDALARGEAAAAGGRFGEALALWRGRALADVAAVEPLALEGARLEELRLVAVEGRAEAGIELGRAVEVTGELEQLVAEHPVRERLWRLLVLALYRGERQADALAACRRAREMLAEELGVEPGEELCGWRRRCCATRSPRRPGGRSVTTCRCR